MRRKESRRSLLRRIQDPVYHPSPEDLKNLRAIAGLTQEQAGKLIMGWSGKGRWPQWEMKEGNIRPGPNASKKILSWASSYSEATKKWMEPFPTLLLEQKMALAEKLGKVILQNAQNGKGSV